MIVFRTLKKRKIDPKGRLKKPHYRAVPVPDKLINEIDLLFDLRARMKIKRTSQDLLWTMGRATAWRMVKRVMAQARIVGPMATTKGLRHGFGIACVMKNRPLHKIRDWLGHTDTRTTEIYTTVVGQEDRELLLEVWR